MRIREFIHQEITPLKMKQRVQPLAPGSHIPPNLIISLTAEISFSLQKQKTGMVSLL
jgi:hypothetical protein